MSKARYIVAVVAVTTALCADQVATAAPISSPPVAQIAARLVERLSRPFRRTVPNVVRAGMQRQPEAADAPAPLPRPASVVALNREFSPFQFRLPPPTV